MNKQIFHLLNIKADEYQLVKHLSLVQFFLGVASAFLFTCSLTLFLSAYEIEQLPNVYILAACLLLVFNTLYARLEARLPSKKLLQVVILLAAFSIFLNWAGLYFIASHWLPFFLAAWYIVVYMVINYAFWGMTAMLFNVRESKRLFSIVGSGEMPAKMLGYFAVTALLPFIGLTHLLWVSIGSFLIAYFLLHNFSRSLDPPHTAEGASVQHPEPIHAEKAKGESLLARYFISPFIFSIAVWSLLAYIIFALIDFTFLADIKYKFTNRQELATFISVFFAVGRFLAILLKLLFSSRMISRIGLSNVLLIVPALLLIINLGIVLAGNSLMINLFVFGLMVLLAEVLKSALQEPVFFILFQPLTPHVRLKGHLLTKGYTLPVALLGVGLFLANYLQQHGDIPIDYVSQLLIFFILLWAASVLFIKKEYLNTIKKV